MSKFGIFAPKLGIQDGYPSVLMSTAFHLPTSRNFHIREGLFQRMPGRLPSLVDEDSVQIAAPKYVYAITAVSQGSKKFTISGNYASNFSGLTSVRVNGSTGNDQLYTLVSATDVAANTEIVVTEVVADATVDGNLFVDTTPVLKYWTHTKDSTGTDYLLLATAYHILLWNYSAKTLTVKHTCATPSDVTHWSIDSLNDKVYATNNSDKILVWDVGTSPSGNFTVLAHASGPDIGGSVRMTKAKYLRAHENTLHVACTTEGGTYYPRRSRACDGADTTEWDATGDNDAFYKDHDQSPGDITGMEVHGTLLVVGKEDKIVLGRQNQIDTVYDWDLHSIQRGCLSADSMVADKSGRFYFLGDDKLIHEIDTIDPVMPQAKPILQSINDANVSKVQATYVKEQDFNSVMFAIPVGTATANDTIVAYEVDTENVSYHEIPVVAFGRYTQQEVYTFATLPYDTFQEWGVAWLHSFQTPLNAIGSVLNLAASSDGKTYELFRSSNDAGSTFTGTLDISTSLSDPPALNLYKRCSDYIELWVNTQSAGSVTVSVMRDGSRTLNSIGTRSMVESGQDMSVLRFPCDIRFRTAIFRISTTAVIEVIGMLFDFEVDGED